MKCLTENDQQHIDALKEKAMKHGLTPQEMMEIDLWDGNVTLKDILSECPEALQYDGNPDGKY